jgi:CheY-like chemotaxis protein
MARRHRYEPGELMTDSTLRVLIVDDDAFLRNSLSQILTGSGFKVRAAGDATAALSEIVKEMPDVLLSDLNMPGLSGFELLAAVRRRFPAIHVIAMSGAFVGDAVPPGVVADAFYEKGRGVNALIEIMAAHRRTAAARAPRRVYEGRNLGQRVWGLER